MAHSRCAMQDRSSIKIFQWLEYKASEATKDTASHSKCFLTRIKKDNCQILFQLWMDPCHQITSMAMTKWFYLTLKQLGNSQWMRRWAKCCQHRQTEMLNCSQTSYTALGQPCKLYSSRNSVTIIKLNSTPRQVKRKRQAQPIKEHSTQPPSTQSL